MKVFKKFENFDEAVCGWCGRTMFRWFPEAFKCIGCMSMVDGEGRRWTGKEVEPPEDVVWTEVPEGACEVREARECRGRAFSV